MVGKSHDVKIQLKVWSKLLEGRIALHKVVVASRELQPATKLDDRTEKSVSKLLKTLVILREKSRRKGQFCRDDESLEDTEFTNQTVDDEFLHARHESYHEIRNQVIEKWCEKTKMGNIPKKGYAALELPTLQLIANSMKDKDRLIRRTQLDRASHLDDSYHPETFNDDDFYHQLLKEMISKDESSRWVELQRLRYKKKRNADTKATKGRKIKKDLIPKLVNFMAPYRPVHLRESEEAMPERVRDELMRTLFGGATRQTETKRRVATSPSVSSDASEVDDEESSLMAEEDYSSG